jgi:hypothetical protein
MKNKLFMGVCSAIIACFFAFKSSKPTLYIIGDSTVKNGSGKGADAMWGWGSVIDAGFDTTRIHIENHAIGGRSSRTFITEGRWDKIMANLKKGDYVRGRLMTLHEPEVQSEARAKKPKKLIICLRKSMKLFILLAGICVNTWTIRIAKGQRLLCVH